MIFFRSLFLAWILGVAGPIFYSNVSWAAQPSHLYTEKILIGTETWPGYLLLYVAQEKGYFKEAGLDVKIKRYVALGDLSRDYAAHKIQDRANLTLDAANEDISPAKLDTDSLIEDRFVRRPDE